MSRAGIAAALLAITAACSGCGDSASSLPWRIEFASAEAREASVHVEATIRQGGCSGEEIYRVVVRRGEAIDGMTPPALEAGSYGFAARSRDADCQWIASGCQNTELPTDGPVVVTLTGTPPAPACEPAQCMDGRCAGEMDAGMDGSTDMDGGIDAATDDAGSDAADDAAMDDAGSDAGQDAAPADAGSDAGPCGGACGECEQCEAGSCVSLDDGTGCGTDMETAGQCYDGECCAGCWNGAVCLDGTDIINCGNFGTMCERCDPGQNCCEIGGCSDFSCPS